MANLRRRRRRRRQAATAQQQNRRAAVRTARNSFPAPTRFQRAARTKSAAAGFTPQFINRRLDQVDRPSRFIPAKRSALVDRPRQIRKHSHGPEQQRFCDRRRDRDHPKKLSRSGARRVQWLAIKC